MANAVRLAVAGAGLIGKRHVESIAKVDEAALAAIVDPTDTAENYARTLGVPWYPSLATLMAEERPEGVIMATPNQVHVENGLECVAADVPILIEKPIAIDVASAQVLVAAADEAGIPILVGHHRRHNPLIQVAKERLSVGAVGTIVAVHAICWFFKPDEYFDVEWRRLPGAGPVFLNLIHDIDVLRYLCGEIVSVQALESNAVRRNAVEETAAIVLRFENGALGTVTISDAIVSPWSWELTAKENPVYHPTGQACYLIGGTHGSLELPNMNLWNNPGERGWWEPVQHAQITFAPADPLVRQIRHFVRVIRGLEPPLVSGREGLKTLQVIEAIKTSACTGKAVHLAS